MTLRISNCRPCPESLREEIEFEEERECDMNLNSLSELRQGISSVAQSSHSHVQK